jgi:hypothetical protein
LKPEASVHRFTLGLDLVASQAFLGPWPPVTFG